MEHIEMPVGIFLTGPMPYEAYALEFGQDERAR